MFLIKLEMILSDSKQERSSHIPLESVGGGKKIIIKKALFCFYTVYVNIWVQL